MDAFDNAFDNIVKTEEVTNTHKKLESEAENSGFKVNETRKHVADSKKLFYGLTKEDRYQAVYENVVPKAYENAEFNVESVKDNIRAQYKKSSIYKVYRFYDYINVCDSILSTIRTQRLPARSYLIGAPNGFGKTSFVNECLITLRRQGYKVAPYISLWELAQIRVDNEHRIMDPYKKFKMEEGSVQYYTEPNLSKGFQKLPEIVTGRYSYSEYINADCLFVYFSDVISKDIESHTLYQLLNIRGAKGLPTIAMISTSLDPYENDMALRTLVWDEIKTYNESHNCYDRVFHVSCYKKKNLGIDNKDEKLDRETGIVY